MLKATLAAAPLPLLLAALVALVTLASGAPDLYQEPLPPTPSSNMTQGQRQARNRKIADRCTTSDGYTGVCMTRFNCMRQSGSVSGYCGTYGVCCETNLECSGSSKLKTVIIKSPTTLPLDTCSYVIEPYSANVCQLHVAFEKFSLQPPVEGDNYALDCSDNLYVNGLTLCGNNEGQHIYVPFNVASGQDHVQLTFSFPTRWSTTTWRLVVTQLECPVAKRRSALTAASPLMPFMGQNSLSDIRTIFSTHHSDLDLIAPPGCLQYHTARQGSVLSFNYNNGNGRYPTDLTYAICFKRSFSDVGIKFTFSDFQLSQQIETATGYDADCHGTVQTVDRREDFLMIPRAIMWPTTALQPTYFCASSIPSGQVVYSGTEGPFVVYFNSDTKTDDTERGFQFQYEVLQTMPY